MTDWSAKLRPDAVLNIESLRLYRLARSRYANLSGVGSAKIPGRWNVPGEEAIYTGTQMATPVLERLVPTSKRMIPANMSMMTLRLIGEWSRTDLLLRERTSGAAILILPSLNKAQSFLQGPFQGARFNMGVFAVALPSVILPVWNLVLYPQTRGFDQHVRVEDIVPFTFDDRLFAADAVHEED